MEIHRPKPFHGWREFAKEIGVIVIGIAIAIGGEQVIERLNRHAEVAEARKALRAEIAQNAGIALINVEEERCHAGLWDKVVGVLNGGQLPPGAGEIKGGLLSQVSSTWDVVKVGAAAHMPFKERVAYSQFYDALEATRYLVERERDATMQTIGLAARTAVTPTDMQRGLEDIGQLRLLGELRGGQSAYIVRVAKGMGVEPAPMPAAASAFLKPLCAAAGMAPTPSAL